MKKKILEKLQSTDGFVSGQELCELLGVSRTAVWKNIQALKNDGYVIEGTRFAFPNFSVVLRKEC